MTAAELATLAFILNTEYQGGGDEGTLRRVARAIAIENRDNPSVALFIEGVEMCGLELGLRLNHQTEVWEDAS